MLGQVSSIWPDLSRTSSLAVDLWPSGRERGIRESYAFYIVKKISIFFLLLLPSRSVDVAMKPLCIRKKKIWRLCVEKYIYIFPADSIMCCVTPFPPTPHPTPILPPINPSLTPPSPLPHSLTTSVSLTVFYLFSHSSVIGRKK